MFCRAETKDECIFYDIRATLNRILLFYGVFRKCPNRHKGVTFPKRMKSETCLRTKGRNILQFQHFRKQICLLKFFKR